MLFSRLVFILAWNHDLPGPTSALGYSAHEVVEDVHAQMEAAAISAVGGSVFTQAGDDLGAERSTACQIVNGGEGHPIAVELWVADSPGALGTPGPDKTIIYYGDHADSHAAADALAAGMPDLDGGLGTWTVEVQHDPTLPSSCPFVRVGIGNIRGTVAPAAMRSPTWIALFSNALHLGILGWITVPIE